MTQTPTTQSKPSPLALRIVEKLDPYTGKESLYDYENRVDPKARLIDAELQGVRKVMKAAPQIRSDQPSGETAARYEWWVDNRLTEALTDLTPESQ